MPSCAHPAVTEDSLYVGDRTGNLHALNRTDGSPSWPSKTLKGQLLATPIVANELIVVAPFNGTNLLEAYHANGDFSWAFAPGN